ncbi:MAG TPA: hypothetical protein VGN55_06670 [Xanthobacteraceae bacterium]|jgi:hypothetical protein
MTEATLPTDRFAASEFRIGGVLNRTWRVLSRNILAFGAVTAVASLPTLLFAGPGQRTGLIIAGALVSDMMRRLSQALLVHAALQELHGARASLRQSLQIGWQRILAVIGLAITASVLTALGFVVLIVPGVMVAVMSFVATPACVVERLDPFSSLERSARLTSGHRWKIFGLLLLVALPLAIAGAVFDEVAEAAGFGTALTTLGEVMGDAIWNAVLAALAISTYHDLRVVKEGVDTVEIAAVFE